MSERLNEAYPDQPSAEYSEQFIGAEEHLDGMREWLRLQNSPLLRNNVPVQYEAAANYLEQIHQAHVEFNPAEAIPGTAPRKLLSNFARYIDNLETDGNNPAVDMSEQFLCDLYDSYAKDVKLFTTAVLPKVALNVALYHKFDILVQLRDNYDAHEFINHSDIGFAFQYKIRNPGEFLERLEHMVYSFQSEVEPVLREEYDQPGYWNRVFVKKLCLKFNPEVRAREIFNKVAEITAQYPQAKRTTIEALAKESVIGGGKKTQLLAELLREIPAINPEVDELIVAKEDLNRLRKAQIKNIYFNNKNPEVHKILALLNFNWRDSFEGLDLESNARHLLAAIRFYNGKPSDEKSNSSIEDSLKNIYNIFCVLADDVYELRKKSWPSAAERVARFHSPSVYDGFREKYKNEQALTIGIIDSFIAKYPADPDANIQKFIFRFEMLTERFGPSINKGIARRFARLTDGAERIDKCLESMKVLKKLFDLNNEEIDHLSLRSIAFSGENPEIQFNKFLDLRRYLRSAFMDDDYVEDWMINQAAAVNSNQEHSVCKLKILRRMNKAGYFNTYIDSDKDGQRSWHQTLSDKNAISPEDALIEMEEYAERQALTRELLSKLDEPDRLAVEVVFGFSVDYNKQDLQEELGVDDLDDYVMNTLIPRLKV